MKYLPGQRECMELMTRLDKFIGRIFGIDKEDENMTEEKEIENAERVETDNKAKENLEDILTEEEYNEAPKEEEELEIVVEEDENGLVNVTVVDLISKDEINEEAQGQSAYTENEAEVSYDEAEKITENEAELDGIENIEAQDTETENSQAEIDVQGTDDLEAENDLVISDTDLVISKNDLVISENDAQNDESEDAAQILNKEIEEARKILEEAKMQAESIIKEAESNAQLIIEEAQGSANEILDDAKDFLRIALESEEKYLYDYKRFVAEKKDEVSSFVIADRADVKKSVVDTRLSMDEVKATLSGAQDSFKAVEAVLGAISSTINEAVNGLTGTLNQVASDVEYKNTEYAWSQFSQIYDQLSATYNAYRYGNSDDFIPKFDVLNRLEMFMEIVELCLEDYALVPFETPVGEKYDIKKHKARVQGNDYDPRNSYVAKSVKKGFMWGDVVRVKEEVEICASIDSLIDDTQMLDNETDNSEE